MAWTTIEVVKKWLEIKESKDDALLIDLISEAEATIDTATHRQFTAASATRYYDPTDPRVVRGPYLYLDEDLVSVTTLTNGDSDVLTASTEYILQPVNTGPPYHVVKLVASGGINWTYVNDPEIAISLLGSWGYAATVPTNIVHACRLLAAYDYRARQAGPEADRTIFAGGTVIAPSQAPQRIAELIDPYRKVF